MKNWIKNADWSKQSSELSRQFGVSVSAVSKARLRHGFPKATNHRSGAGRQKTTDWSKVDWTYSDTGISKSLNCSRQTVWRNRKIHEKPLRHAQ